MCSFAGGDYHYVGSDNGCEIIKGWGSLGSFLCFCFSFALYLGLSRDCHLCCGVSLGLWKGSRGGIRGGTGSMSNTVWQER